MISITASAWRLAAAVSLLTLVFLGQSFAASRTKSPVFDEPPHIAAGLSYLATHTFHANPQHPPLLKELSAISLHLAGIRWPASTQTRALTAGAPGTALEWPIGNDIIASNGPDRVLFWARLPLILLAAGLGIVIYLWGSALFGTTAGLCALFLYVLDPTIVAHSFLVTTDVGVTAFSTLFLFLLWRTANRPTTAGWILCGLALGAALAAKFTAIFLLPVAAILLQLKTTDVKRTARAMAGCCVAALLVVEICYFFGPPRLYLDGLTRINADHLAGAQAYFNGYLARRFLTYFAAAFLLKEPLATLGLTAAGAVLLWRRAETSRFTKAFFLIPVLIFVLAPTLLADDLGIRYIMPVFPFAFLLGGLALARLIGNTDTAGTPTAPETPARWTRPAAAALCAWLGIAAVGIYPDHLSYFNEAACLLAEPRHIGLDGGSRCGPLWLDDSNVDWGQSVKQLRAWADTHAPGQTLRMAYFGSFPPEHYGLRVEQVKPETLLSRPSPGLYAVSAFWVGRIPAAVEAVAPGAESWLAETPPRAVVGHAYYIYDVR